MPLAARLDPRTKPVVVQVKLGSIVKTVHGEGGNVDPAEDGSKAINVVCENAVVADSNCSIRNRQIPVSAVVVLFCNGRNMWGEF